jgi:hypothetical protein
MSDRAPLVVTIKETTDPVAAGNDQTTVIDEARFAGTVTAVAYIPLAGINGANTNSRTISVINKGGAGAGSAVAATLALVSGTNLAADRENALPLSGTPANFVVAEHDVLEFTSAHVGAGIADPGGEIRVTLSRS